MLVITFSFYYFLLMLCIETVLANNYSCGAFHQASLLNLSCGTVSISGHTKPPRVEWYFQANSSTFLPLNDSSYWFQQYQLHLCKFGRGHYRRFEGPSSFDCAMKEKLPNSTEVFICNYSHADIIPMQYRCRISTYQADKRYMAHKVKDILVKGK